MEQRTDLRIRSPELVSVEVHPIPAARSVEGQKSSIAMRDSGLCSVRWNMEAPNHTLPNIAVVVGCFAAMLGGCGLNNFRDVSLSDRCADVIQRAFPEARIEITALAL
jgi:hypothetical protein